MNNNNILLLGGSGFLGSFIQKEFKSNSILAPSHNLLDLHDLTQIVTYINKNDISYIIYAAGITRINEAQNNRDEAMLLNYEIPTKIAEYATKMNIRFCYISTDAVFDGYDEKYIFKETDIPKTKSIYGTSKMQAERSILSNNSDHCVLRLITLYGLYHKKPNFISEFIKKLRNGQTYLGIVDQIQNPTYVVSAARAVIYAVKNDLHGIYHIGALDSETNYNFLSKAAAIFHLDQNLIQQIEYAKLMKEQALFRKKDSVLLCGKFDTVSNHSILQTLDKSLAELHETMK